MPVTVIAERIGWDRSIRTLSTRVPELRPVYLPPDPASRTTYLPGEIAQCDFWFPPITLPVDHGHDRTATKLPVLTMTRGYSRWFSALLIPTRGGRRPVRRLVASDRRTRRSARVLAWDGEGAIGRWRHHKVELTQDCQGFRGTLGAEVLVCKPADPEAKGIIERNHDYLETSFLPGRSFTGPNDFNRQLSAWLAIANSRRKRALGCAPADRIDADRARMLELPPVPHEEFLVARLQREVSTRESHGGESRIRAARFPARKSLEEFYFDHARGLQRDAIAHLGTLDFVTAKDNVVFLGPPGTGKTHLAIGLAIRACQSGHRVLFFYCSPVGFTPCRCSLWLCQLNWAVSQG